MTYIALLKGINVTGHHIIKMAELKAMFEAIGMKNVRTFIQSGNVVFESPAKPAALCKKIEAHLEKELGYFVTVVIRSMAEMESIVKGYPFSKFKGHEECKVSVSFLNAEPVKENIKELHSLNSDNEMFHVNGSDVYQICRSNFSDSLAGKNIIEKKLKVKATTRNWNTVNKILNV